MMEILILAASGGRRGILHEIWRQFHLLEGDRARGLTNSEEAWLRDVIDESKAVWFAAKGGHAELLRELLRAVPGVDAGAADPRTGVTAIAVARQNQRTAAVAALVDHTGGGSDGSTGSGGSGETKAPAWVPVHELRTVRQGAGPVRRSNPPPRRAAGGTFHGARLAGPASRRSDCDRRRERSSSSMARRWSSRTAIRGPGKRPSSAGSWTTV